MLLRSPFKEKTISIDIMSNNLGIIVGFSQGSVCVFNLISGKILKSFEKITENPIMKVKYLESSNNISGKISFLIVSDDKILKVKWKDKNVLNIKTKETFKKENINHYYNMKQILEVFPLFLQSQKKSIKILSVLTKESFLLINLKYLKSSLYEIKKPDSLGFDCFPQMHWNKNSNNSNYFMKLL